MNRAAILAGLLTTLSFLGTARADEAPNITGVEVRLGDELAEILVLSPQALPAPRIRLDRGAIRAWFRGVDQERITERGDGLAIQNVRVRSGAADSALVRIQLGDRRRLSEEVVQLDAFEGGYAIRIARSALPLAPETVVVAPEPSEDEAVQTDDVADEAQEATATEERAAETDTEPATEEAAAPREPTAHPLALSSTTGPTESSLPYGLILLITVLLGALHLVMRFVAKKKNALPAPDISVVASKRVGPRHQLLVVRALGEEHLLSVNAGQTQIITSVTQSTAISMAATEPALSLPQPAPTKDTPTDSLARKLGLPASAIPAAKAALSPDERFGARLLELAGARRDHGTRTDRLSAPPSQAETLRAPRTPTLSGLNPGRGEASSAAHQESPVAGLLALRQRP